MMPETWTGHFPPVFLEAQGVKHYGHEDTVLGPFCSAYGQGLQMTCKYCAEFKTALPISCKASARVTP